MRIIPTPSFSAKVATGLDLMGTLIIAEIGFAFKLPFYHPVILGSAGGMAFILFKWKDEITQELLKIAAPLQNKNVYDFYNRFTLKKIEFKLKMLQRMLNKKVGKKERDIYLFFSEDAN